jgi:hypothetical protein
MALAPGAGASSLGRVTLAPDGALPMRAGGDATHVLVMQGTVVMTTNDQGLVARSRHGDVRSVGTEDTLVGGEALHLRVGTTGSWQAGAEEPVVLLFLTGGAVPRNDGKGTPPA